MVSVMFLPVGTRTKKCSSSYSECILLEGNAKVR